MSNFILRPFLFFVTVTFFMHCGHSQGAGNREEEKLLDKLTYFVEAVQSEQWNKALDLVSPKERNALLGDASQLSEATKARLKALKLSTAAHQGRVFLVKNRLEGISDILPREIKPPPQESRQEVPSFQ